MYFFLQVPCILATKRRALLEFLLVVAARVVGILHPLVAGFAAVVFFDFVAISLARSELARWLGLRRVLSELPLIDEFAPLRLPAFIELGHLVRVVDNRLELLLR